VKKNKEETYAETEARLKAEGVRLAWLAKADRTVTTAHNGTPLYCPTHARYVGFNGLFPCVDCGGAG